MKHSITSLVALLSITATTLAQYTVQSKPFFLVLHSHDNKYNGTTLEACHEGAGIEGLCTGGTFNASSGYSTFQFNTTANEFVGNATLGKTGYLTYELVGGNFNESEPMVLSTDPSSNVALPIFEGGYDETLVAFDTHHRMNIQSYVDDTVSPPTDDKVMGYYRWYVCQSNFLGYTYETLNWVMGKYPPENPSCCKVQVVRQFV